MKSTNCGVAPRLARRGGRSQSGQAVIWMLALLVSMSMVMVGIYSTGKVTSERQKLTNATDAAAYSGALVQARALNMVAYANRASIANEVLLAQAVSLHSWTKYNAVAVENVRTVVDIVSVFVWPLAAVSQVLSAIEEVLEQVDDAMDDVIPAVVEAIERYYQGFDLGFVQVVFAPGVLALAGTDAAGSVLAQNYETHVGSTDQAPSPYLQAELGTLNVAAWQGMFARYDSGKAVSNGSDGRQTTHDILVHSRDAFSTRRQGPGGSVGSPGYMLGLLFGNESFGNCVTGSIGSSRDGPTELVDFERWEAQDTSRLRFRAPGQCKGSTNVPVGWGRATLDESGDEGNMRTSPHRFEGLQAYNDNASNHSRWSGVKALYDVERDTSTGRPIQRHLDQELVFHFAAIKSRQAVRANDTLGVLNGRTESNGLGAPHLQPHLHSDQVTAIAAAKVFFERPRRDSADFTGRWLHRNDAHKEVANLYNPYWQVRLTQPSASAMAMAYGGNAAMAVFSQSSGLSAGSR